MVLRLSLYSSSLPGGTRTIHILITVYLVVLSIPLLIPILIITVSLVVLRLSIPINYLITVFLVVLRVSLYLSKSPWWNSDFTYTHHRLPTQTISYSSQSPWWYSDYPFTHHCLMVLRLPLYSTQSTWWSSDYPYTHHSLICGTQTIPKLIPVSLVVLRLSLDSSQSIPYTHHSLPDGTQRISMFHSLSQSPWVVLS